MVIDLVSVYDKCKATKYADKKEYIPLDNKFTSLFTPLEHKCAKPNSKYYQNSHHKPFKQDNGDIKVKGSFKNISINTSLTGDSGSGESIILSDAELSMT